MALGRFGPAAIVRATFAFGSNPEKLNAKRSFRPQKWVFCFKKLKILRMNQAHRS